jgi:hypothetical protein
MVHRSQEVIQNQVLLYGSEPQDKRPNSRRFSEPNFRHVFVRGDHTPIEATSAATLPTVTRRSLAAGRNRPLLNDDELRGQGARAQLYRQLLGCLDREIAAHLP